MKRTHPRYKSRKSRGSLKRRTQRRQRPTCSKHEIIGNFMEIINAVKVYHWNTHSFAQHKATDELYERLNDHVDKFVEVLLGKKDDRLKNLDRHIPLRNYKSTADLKTRLYQYRDYLSNLDSCLDAKHDTDLLNIRDEILADLNQFLYLLTLH